MTRTPTLASPIRAAAALLALAAAGLSLPAAAQTIGPATVAGGTAIWGLSAYLGSPNFGRPNPHPEAYIEPATFDETTRLSTWGDATGAIAADGSATLAYNGAALNFTSTGGGWLRLANLEVSLDPSGNGTVSAEVSYGTSVTGTPPSMEFDPQQAPEQGPQRVVVVELEGNSVSPTLEDGIATWSDLAGVWASAFTDFLGVGPWAYASTVTNGTEGREPLPLTLTAVLAP